MWLVDDGKKATKTDKFIARQQTTTIKQKPERDVEMWARAAQENKKYACARVVRVCSSESKLN